jgi:hypothetical protein
MTAIKKGPTVFRRSGLSDYCRQRPTLPHSFPCSTIGGIKLNFRVRNGNGCDPDPMTTGMLGAWGPAMRIAALKPRVNSHRRSSQTISKSNW